MQTALPLVRATALLLLIAAGFPAPAQAARLRPETEAAWQQYVRETEARRERDLAAMPRTASAEPAAPTSSPPASSPPSPAGRVLVTPAGEGGTDGSVEVPSGLIHHWRGSVLIPGVTLADVLHHVRQAPRQADVLESKILEDRGDSLRVYLKLTRKEIITVTYNTEHRVELRRHGDGLASSRSVATKIAELDDPGTPREREKPADEDLGLLWRLNAYWRYEEVPGGVLVECESLSLSRAIPTLLKPIASGMVDGVARESMTRTLDTMRAQLQKRPAAAAARPAPPTSAGDDGPATVSGRLGHSPKSVAYLSSINRRMSEGPFPTADFTGR